MNNKMHIAADLHIHTLASGHAYSTVQEVVNKAAVKGLRALALTEHGPAMPGGAHEYYFGNLRVIPRKWKGVYVLRGVEANIIDYQGNIDLKPFYLKKLDLVWAALHTPCIKPGTVEENTAAFTGALCSPFVHGIAHPGNPDFPIDGERIVKVAVQERKLLEINNSSFMVRQGSFSYCHEIARLAKRYQADVCLNSDAHIACDVGNHQQAWELVQETGMPGEQVINTSLEKVLAFLNIT